MNLNIYLEDALANSLNQCVKETGQSRNALIREAIKEWLTHHLTKKWPNSIMKFKGISGVEPFESHRNDLLPPDEDPFK